MKPKRSQAPPPKKAPPKAAPRWPIFAVVAGALIVALWAYGPSFHAPFLFDDTVVFPGSGAALSFAQWVNRIRPVLMLSYWANAKTTGGDTFAYHLVNVLIHCAASALMYFAVRRILQWANVEPRLRAPLAGFCAALFLTHPAQSEAVAYLAGRSEA